MALGVIDTVAGIKTIMRVSNCHSLLRLTVCAFAVGVHVYVCPGWCE